MAKKRHSKFKITIALTLAIILIVLAVLGWYMYTYHNDTFMEYYNILFNKEETDNSGNEGDKTPVIIEGELSIHFLDLGNSSPGDCIYIKAGDTDMLVDAGSTAGSMETIGAYLDNYVTDGVFEYVVVTHSDLDHIACFQSDGGIFDTYECEIIIDFPQSGSTSKAYANYLKKREAEVAAGAKHYTALECWNQTNGASKVWNLSEDVTMTILYHKFYETKASDENNNSVCFLLTHGDRNFLFTGDLEKAGEESLVEENDLPEVELFKAGHHGSPTSSNDELLSVIKPQIVCVSCCAGSPKHGKSMPTTFPTQVMIDRIAKYTDRVYVPSAIDSRYVTDEDGKQKLEAVGDYYLLNGNIVVLSDEEKVTVNCSNNNSLLKDTDWFKEYRDTPSEWEKAA